MLYLHFQFLDGLAALAKERHPDSDLDTDIRNRRDLYILLLTLDILLGKLSLSGINLFLFRIILKFLLLLTVLAIDWGLFQLWLKSNA